MTADFFLKLLFEEYETNFINTSVNKENLERQKINVADFSYKTVISSEDAQNLSRKICAKILHVFFEKVLKLPDVEWTVSKNLKDIYECAVCANSIAQVVERGIMTPKNDDAFVLNDLVSGEEIKKILGNFRILVKNYFFVQK